MNTIPAGTQVWYLDDGDIKEGIVVESFGELGDWITYTIEGRGDKRFLAAVQRTFADALTDEMRKRGINVEF